MHAQICTEKMNQIEFQLAWYWSCGSWDNPNAAINEYLELTLLKGRQRFDAISTSNLEVHKFWDWCISPNLFLNMMNLYLVKFEVRWILNERAFYCFIILFIWKWILTDKSQFSLVNLHPTLFLRQWILNQLL